MVIKGVVVGMYGANCFLLGDEESAKCALVDPGDEPAKIMSMLKSVDMELSAILITHGHSDHVSAVPALLQKFPGVPVYVHALEIDPGRTPNHGMLMPACDTMQHIEEGSKIALGALEISVLSTPGHSKGSVVFQVGDVLFTGDTLFKGTCGRTDFHGGSYGEMMQSLKRLHDLDGDYRICPGHEGATTLAQERGFNSFMKEAARSKG